MSTISGDTENGFGKYQWSSGKTYEGGWAGGKRHGEGILKWSSGHGFEGQWKNGKKHGTGVSKYASGNVYDGEWQDKQHGTGRFTFVDGASWEGPWRAGEPSGPGTWRFPGGLAVGGDGPSITERADQPAAPANWRTVAEAKAARDAEAAEAVAAAAAAAAAAVLAAEKEKAAEDQVMPSAPPRQPIIAAAGGGIAPVPPLPPGTAVVPRLHLRVCAARGLKATQSFFGTQDPYVQVRSTDGFLASTATHGNGGAAAEWGQKFELELGGKAAQLQFDVMNDNMTKDVLIGSLVLDVDSLFEVFPPARALSLMVDAWFPIAQRSRGGGLSPSGELHLRMQLEGVLATSAGLAARGKAALIAALGPSHPQSRLTRSQQAAAAVGARC
jgi:hypothetical protein